MKSFSLATSLIISNSLATSKSRDNVSIKLSLVQFFRYNV